MVTKSKYIFLTIILSFLFAACSTAPVTSPSESSPTPSATGTPTPTATTSPTPTATPTPTPVLIFIPPGRTYDYTDKTTGRADWQSEVSQNGYVAIADFFSETVSVRDLLNGDKVVFNFFYTFTLGYFEGEEVQTVDLVGGRYLSVAGYMLGCVPDDTAPLGCNFEYEDYWKAWDINTGSPVDPLTIGDDSLAFHLAALQVIGNPASFRASASSNDKTFLLYSPMTSLSGEITIWNIAEQTSTPLGNHEDVMALATSPDDAQALSLSPNGELRVWDIATRTLVGAFLIEPNIQQLVWTNSNRILTVDERDVISLRTPAWQGVDASQLQAITPKNANRLQLISTIDVQPTSITSLAPSPNNDLLAIGLMDGSVLLYDIVQGEFVATLSRHTDTITSLAFSPDGKILASAGANGLIVLWDMQGEQVLHGLGGHQGGTLSVAFNPKGTVLASGGQDNNVRLWNVENGKELAALEGHSSTVGAVSFNPRGSVLGSAGDDGAIGLWDPDTYQSVATLDGSPGKFTSLAFSPVSQTLVAGTTAGQVQRWNLLDNSRIAEFDYHSGSINSIAFSSDGEIIVSGSGDKALVLWGIVDQSMLMSIPLKGNPTNSAVSPDGKLIFIGIQDGYIYLLGVLR